MFEWNDRALCIYKVLANIIGILGSIVSVIAGIVLTGITRNGLYLLYAAIGCFACWICWLCEQLLISFLVDVKLIRNKLYGQSNNGLISAFVKSKPDTTNAGENPTVEK